MSFEMDMNVTNHHDNAMSAVNGLSEEEQAIYDRQLRVWGLEAQKKIRDSNILLVGLNGVATEICKNLVLSGIGSITIVEHKKVEPRDLISQFFVSEADLNCNRAVAALKSIESLNPNVKIQIVQENISTYDATFFHAFNAVILADCSVTEQIRINEIVRSAPHQIAFFATQIFGFFAYFFEDLNLHTYVITKKSEGEGGAVKEEQTVHTLQYTSLKQTLDTSWSGMLSLFSRRSDRAIAKLYFSIQILLSYEREHGQFPTISSSPDNSNDSSATSSSSLVSLKNSTLQSHGLSIDVIPDDFFLSFIQVCKCELAPTCAIVGGILGGEVLKVLSGLDLPYNNFVIYDAKLGHAICKCIS